MAESQDELFGQLAVSKQFATRPQVDECLEIQRKLGAVGLPPKRVGDILVERGYLTPEQAATIFAAQSQAGKPHTLIAGYEILAKVGQGGMGAVYRARQLSMDRIVALKVLPARLAKDPTYVERFVREARAVAKLNHENIIQGIDVGQEKGVHYFVMEYVEGATVTLMLKKQGYLPEDKTLQIGLQIARALEHAHKNGLIHRDVKPDNIMVTKEGVAKLCDLGLAKRVAQDSSITQEGTSVGTPHYISPEQARGDPVIDIRADLYSLGASLYHILTGQVPFDGENALIVMTKHITETPVPPVMLRKELSKATNAIVLKMMAKEPGDRYQTPAELIADLEAAAQHRLPAAAGAAAPAVAAAAAPGAVGGPATASRMAHRKGSETRTSRTVRDTDSGVRRRPPSPAASPLTTYIGGGAVLLVALALVWFLSRPEAKPPDPNPAPGPGPTIGPGPGPDPGHTDPVKPPIVRPGPGPNPSPREKDPAGFLEAIRLSIAGAGNDPGKLLDVSQRFEEYYDTFRNTKSEHLADKDRDEFRKRLEAAAQAHVDGLDAKSQAEAGQDRLFAAIQVYKDIPAAFRNTLAAARANQRVADLTQQLEQRHAADLARVEQLAAAGDFDAAAKVLEAIGGYGSDDHKRAAEGRARLLAAEKEKFRDEKVRQAQTEYDTIFAPELEKRLRAGAYDKACQWAEEALARDPLKYLPERVGEDLKDARLLVSVRADTLENLAEAARAGTEITLGKVRGKVVADKGRYCVSYSENKVTLTLPIELEKLTAKELGTLHALRKGQGEDAAQQMKRGLLFFFGGELRDAQPAFERAFTLYEKGGERGAAERARAYLRRVEAANAASGNEAAARELLAKARAAVREKRYPEALRLLGELRDTYGNLPSVQAAAGEIADLEAQCREKGGPAVAAAGAGGGPKLVVEGVRSNQHPGCTTWIYDFAKKNQLEDWHCADISAQMFYVEAKKHIRIQDSQWYWKGELKGNVWIEVRCVPAKKNNLAITLCDNQKLFPEARCYYVGWNVEDMPLIDALPPQFRGRAMQSLTTPHRIVRFDYPRIGLGRPFEAIRPLGGESFPANFMHIPINLMVQRDNGNLTASIPNIGWLPLQPGMDATELDQGYVSLCLYRCEAEIDRVVITGTLASPAGGGK